MKIKLNLKRHTSSTKFIPEIDGLRFFSIITVVIIHVTTSITRHNTDIATALHKTTYYSIIKHGALGVSVFFAISGFILSLPFIRYYNGQGKKVSLKKYFLKRLTRLEPPYILSLTIFFIGLLLTGTLDFPEGIKHYFSSFFYSHMFIYGEWSPINPVTWSLETEVQFYILAPVFTTIFLWQNKLLRTIALILFTLIAAYNFGISYRQLENIHLHKSIIHYLGNFFVGILFADFYNSNIEFLKKKVWYWDIIGLIAFCSLFITNGDTNIAPAFILAVFIIFISIFKGPLLNAFHNKDWVVIIGGMCYSIYLSCIMV